MTIIQIEELKTNGGPPVRRHSTMLMLPICLLFAIALNTPCVTADNVADLEDSTVLMAAFSPCRSDADVVVLATTLSVKVLRESSPHEAARLSLDEGYSQALENLRTRNPVSVEFPSGFRCPRLKLVERSSVASALEHGDWQSFSRAFPGIVKLIEISLPATIELMIEQLSRFRCRAASTADPTI